MNPGQYQAKPIEWGITDKGRFEVEFETIEGERIKASYGFASDKQIAYSESQIKALGYDGEDYDEATLSSDVVTIVVKPNAQKPQYMDVSVQTGSGIRKADKAKGKEFMAQLKARKQGAGFPDAF